VKQQQPIVSYTSSYNILFVLSHNRQTRTNEHYKYIQYYMCVCPVPWNLQHTPRSPRISNIGCKQNNLGYVECDLYCRAPPSHISVRTNVCYISDAFINFDGTLRYAIYGTLRHVMLVLCSYLNGTLPSCERLSLVHELLSLQRLGEHIGVHVSSTQMLHHSLSVAHSLLQPVVSDVDMSCPLRT
jgi:hypothetical protein